MAEIDASMISPGVDMSKLGDPSKYDFIPDKSGKYIPVLKNTPIAQRAGEVFKERIIDRPTNPIGAAVRGASDALKGASTVLGSIGPAIGEATADTPEEKEYRHNQLLQKWNKPTKDLGAVSASNVVKSNVGRDASDAEMADATSPSTMEAANTIVGPQGRQDATKAYLQSIGYDTESPAFKTMENNFKEYKASQVAAANAEADVFLETRDKLERAENDRAIKSANFDAETQKSVRDYGALNNKFIDMTLNMPNRQETENNYWANKTNKSRVFGLLSLGFGNAQTWANYNNVIDSELRAQQEKMKLFDKGLTNQQTLVGMNRDIAKDDNDAFLMAKNTMLQMSEMVLKSIAAKKGTREAMYNAGKDIDKIRYEREQIENQLAMSVKSKFLNQQADEQSIEPETPIMQVPSHRRERFIPGFGEGFGDKETLKKFRGTAGELLPAYEAIKTLRSISDLPVTERANAFSKVSAQSGITKSVIIGALKTMITGTGTFSDKDREIVEKTVGDPTKVDFLKLESKKLDTLLQLIQKNLNTQAELSGIDTTYKNRWKINREIKSYAPSIMENK